MKVKFYLDSKSQKSGENAIWCYIREYDKTLALNTGECLKPELWDKDLHRANVRKTRDKVVKNELNFINQYLNTFENRIFEITRTIRSKNFNADFNVVADAIKKQFDKRGTSIFAVYD